jgi:predicted nuclease with TOPRIM domain
MGRIGEEAAADWKKIPEFKAFWDFLQELGRKQAESAARFEKEREEDSRKQAERDARFEKEREEDRRKQAERDARFEKEKAERDARFEKEKAERDKSLSRLEETVGRLGSNVGGLNNSIGDLVETLFMPHLGEKFDAYNYNLKRQFRRVYIYDETNRLRSEIDILLSNTTVCMAVEVKRWLERNDQVDEHIKRMELIRKYPPAETKGKKLLGAIVGVVVTPEVREYAQQSGFFMLELKGEDIHLIEPPKDFKPKEW